MSSADEFSGGPAGGPVTDYPVRFTVDYEDQPRNRLTTLFRIILVIPIGIVFALVDGGVGLARANETTSTIGHDTVTVFVGGGGLLVAAPLLMLLFRRKYPRWWFDWNLNLLRFANRVSAYLALLRDEYPSTDDEQAVHLDIVYPEADRDLNRWLPLVKWLLAIPHYIVLFFLGIAALVCVVIAWFAILFTGTYPRGLFDFVVGVQRWNNRVVAYAVLLVTDQYPPFQLS